MIHCYMWALCKWLALGFKGQKSSVSFGEMDWWLEEKSDSTFDLWILKVFTPLPSPCVGFPWWLSGKESACQSRRCGFDSWVGKIPWRRKWQATPVFLSEKSNGQRSLAGYSPWGRKESDTTQGLNNNNLSLWPHLGQLNKASTLAPAGDSDHKRLHPDPTSNHSENPDWPPALPLSQAHSACWKDLNYLSIKPPPPFLVCVGHHQSWHSKQISGGGGPFCFGRATIIAAFCLKWELHSMHLSFDLDHHKHPRTCLTMQ